MKKAASKIVNLQSAIQKLDEAAALYLEDKANDIVRDGLIQRFEFTYELAWKAAKAYLEDLGLVDKNSPKAVFQELYAQDLIANEENWLQILRDRNHTSRLYSQDLAEKIAERIVNTHLQEFRNLLARIQ